LQDHRVSCQCLMVSCPAIFFPEPLVRHPARPEHKTDPSDKMVCPENQFVAGMSMQGHHNQMAPHEALDRPHHNEQNFEHFTPEDTIIIWDWDDTLLCSTAIRHEQLYLGKLPELENLAKCLLEMSLKVGDVKIVTNGEQGWVTETTTHYLPELIPIVMRYPSPVISARSSYEDVWPGDPRAWKLQAFKDVLLGRQNRRQSCKNIIVIGDSFVEIDAAQEVAKQLNGQVSLKTVKLLEEPSQDNLVAQLEALRQTFSAIVQEPRPATLTLVPSIPCNFYGPSTSFQLQGLCPQLHMYAVDDPQEGESSAILFLPRKVVDGNEKCHLKFIAHGA